MKKLIVHPRYDKGTVDNDISILYLAQEVDLATYTPACLAGADEFTAYDGKMALSLGNLIAQSSTLKWK